MKPELIVGRGPVLYVFDYGDHALKAFSVDGRLLWRFGRKGSGPGEFVNPTDLKIDGRDAVWLADPANSRVTIVDGHGRLVRTMPTTVAVEHLLPLATGEFLGFGYSGDKPAFSRYDSLGHSAQPIGYPVWMDTVPSLVSELRVAGSPDGRSAAVASYYSGRLLLMRHGASGVREIPVVETQAFPTPITYSPSPRMTVRRFPPEARPLVRALTADSEFVYALIAGTHKERGRILDVYRLLDGSYHGSYLLPQPVAAMTVVAHGLAVLVNEPMPSLYYLERRAPGR
ncbi:MAG: hypothetical protein C0497_13390 [Gemmatimonas sp.]|nr:hypothetical protein [Gemmatimonas sp.]